MMVHATNYSLDRFLKAGRWRRVFSLEEEEEIRMDLDLEKTAT